MQVWAENNGAETFTQVVSSNFEVIGNTPAAVNPSGNTYVYRGTAFQVVPNLKSEYCTRYAKVSLPEDALKAAYDCVLNNRMPVILGVYGPTSSHVVTVVGVNQNAARSSLTLSDFLIVDPYGGTIRTLSYYNSLDCEWALRIPI